MKYAQIKVPQQGNAYDCGLYILYYIEVFLSKSSLQDLIVSSLEGGAHFTRLDFTMEVFDKCNYIRRLIFHHGGMLQVDDGNHLSIQPMPREEVGLVPSQRYHHQGSGEVVKEMKSKKWKERETSILLQCVVGGGRFNKGKLGAMHWDLIAKEINIENDAGPLRLKEQCQNRFDTLLKAYKDLNAYCLRMGKEFCQVTKDEKRSLKLATPLEKEHEEWYNHLHTIYNQRSSLRVQSHKRRKSNVDGDMDVNKLASSPIHPSQQCPPPLDVIGSSKSMKPSSRQVVVQEFNKLEKALRYTFFNLIGVWSLETCFEVLYGREDEVIEVLSLEVLCRRLAIVQDRNPLEIHNHVYQLQDLKLVTFVDVGFDVVHLGDCWMDKIWVDFSSFEVYKKIGRKVLSKNPHLNTFHRLSRSVVIVTKLCLVQQIRVLKLWECDELENVDLGNFPNLCCLDIMHCEKLKVVNGWEGAKGLGWIEIWGCPSYCYLPDVQFLSSLKEFSFGNCRRPRIPWQLANFSQCVQLWRLDFFHANDLVESMDLKALRFLEVLSFTWCRALSTIHGLSGLQALMKLKLWGCESLENVPNLGCLKALTYLDMNSCGIVEILGVEKLHLLTFLDLSGCQSLESLPPLGHLKALAYLDLSRSGIEEIPGVEDLVSLETLHCYGSKLKRLPNLDHLLDCIKFKFMALLCLEWIHQGFSIEDMS